MKNIIVFGLDGTLSIVGDRLKHLQGPKKDWDAFYEACGEDAINKPIAGILQFYYNEALDFDTIKVVTGRRESLRQKTLDWFELNEIYVRSRNLYMRPDGDYRHDTEVKPELVKDFIGDIKMVFEDRASMVKKWRELGITCLQVAEGEF